MAVPGALALAWAALVDATWFELHFTPSYCALDPADRARSVPWRIGAAVAGVVLLAVVRPVVARWAGRRSARRALLDVAPVALAVLLALVFCEVLRRHKRGGGARSSSGSRCPPTMATRASAGASALPRRRS